MGVFWNDGSESSGILTSVTADTIKHLKRGFGYDIQSHEFVDMRENDIIDSARSARLALQCASSAASTLMIVEAGVPLRKKNKTEKTKMLGKEKM